MKKIYSVGFSEMFCGDGETWSKSIYTVLYTSQYALFEKKGNRDMNGANALNSKTLPGTVSLLAQKFRTTIYSEISCH